MEIQIDELAQKDFDDLPSKIADRVLDKIKGLATDPFPIQSKKLKGYDNTWRLRVGDYRILYTIETDTLIVLRIGHRREVYR